ncbi:hypothetical protein ANN_17620 [Periplaneta americana]|uniref:CGG triplet repeat-binding protein 1 n=1 Tax=Periplaneta americana TaxID=6978 RepID=A0ABQ8SUS4_PERAM|nr:hypothetical protein ANN_17620 [Periplaneta americana]
MRRKTRGDNFDDCLNLVESSLMSGSVLVHVVICSRIFVNFEWIMTLSVVLGCLTIFVNFEWIMTLSVVLGCLTPTDTRKEMDNESDDGVLPDNSNAKENRPSENGLLQIRDFPSSVTGKENVTECYIRNDRKRRYKEWLINRSVVLGECNTVLLEDPWVKWRHFDFSCAAQQLNASQSTHRFSFVNHTIKTVNMPKVRHSVNLKSKLTSYISEFKEDGLSTDNKILFCNLCQCAVSSTQKFLVQQHITTSKHQANKQLNSKQRQLFLTQPTTSNVRSEFNIDLCRSLISADIPLYKLKNKVFREFLEKYTQHTIPDESTLRKTYAPSIYDETIQKIRDEIKDSSIWVSIDETPDKEGRLVGNVVIGFVK